MPIRVPLELVNQTGPEWDKFVQQAKKAGFELKDIGNVGNEVFDNIVKKKLKESREAVDKLADSFVGADRQRARLSDGVRYLNAMNITPRGYEMFSYRMSLLAENLGKALIPIAGLGAAAYTAISSVNSLAERGDKQAIELQRSWLSVGDALGFVGRQALLATNETNWFKGAVKGATELGAGIGDFIVHPMEAVRQKINLTNIALLNLGKNIPGIGKDTREMLDAAIRQEKYHYELDQKAVDERESKRGPDRIAELRRPVDKHVADESRLKEINAVRTLVDLDLARKKLMAEINAIANRGAFREEEAVRFRRELLALAEKERGLMIEQANILKAAEQSMREMVKARAQVFAGKSEGAGKGLAEDIRGSASPKEMNRQIAQNRAEEIAAQRGITDPDEIRKLAAGQLSAIERGGIAAGRRGKRGISQEDIAKAQGQIGRRKIADLVEQGKLDPVTGQALSDAFDARGREVDEAATMRDQMQNLNRRGHGAARRNAFDRAGGMAKRELQRGDQAPDQAANKIGGAMGEIAKREAAAFQTRNKADEQQMKVLRDHQELLLNEMEANRVRDRMLRAMQKEMGTAKAKANQFTN